MCQYLAEPGLRLTSVFSQSPCSALPCPFALECVEMGHCRLRSRVFPFLPLGSRAGPRRIPLAPREDLAFATPAAWDLTALSLGPGWTLPSPGGCLARAGLPGPEGLCFLAGGRRSPGVPQ